MLTSHKLHTNTIRDEPQFRFLQTNNIWPSKHGALETWRIVPLCVMWCLWSERNARNFEDRELGLMELKKRVAQTLFSWRVLWHSPQATLAEFLDFCATFSS